MHITRDNAAKQIYIMTEALSHKRQEVHAPIRNAQDAILESYDSFSKYGWDQALADIPDAESRKLAFFQEVIDDSSDFSTKLSNQLQQEFQRLQQLWKQSVQQSRSLERQLVGKLSPLVQLVKAHIKDFQFNVLNNRPDPNRVSDPHPTNIRVVGTVSQNYGATGPHGMSHPDDLTLGNKAWISAIKNTHSLDKAIDMYQNWAVVPSGLDPNVPDTEFHIVSPVSTKRQKANAWQKADNTNPLVRRIALFVDDGVENMMNQTNGVMANFQKVSPQHAQNLDGYRVDEILVVRPPNPQEQGQGITIHDKLQEAFSAMKRFSTLGPAGNGLRYEAYISWQGHGAAELPEALSTQEKRTGQLVPQRFQEGMMDFTLAFHPSDSDKNLKESEIKAFEREYLGGFDYVVEQSGSCASGALTA